MGMAVRRALSEDPPCRHRQKFESARPFRDQRHEVRRTNGKRTRSSFPMREYDNAPRLAAPPAASEPGSRLLHQDRSPGCRIKRFDEADAVGS